MSTPAPPKKRWAESYKLNLALLRPSFSVSGVSATDSTFSIKSKAGNERVRPNSGSGCALEVTDSDPS